MTVTDLLEDRVTLDGVLLKCNREPYKARTDSECMNARIAIERLASQSERAEEAKRAEEFEHNREKLRLAQEKLRQEQEAKEAKAKVDVYHLPVVPVEPTATPAPPSNDTNPPIARESNP